jgi:DNA polymerase-1
VSLKAILDGDMYCYAAAEQTVFTVVKHGEMICCQTDVAEAWINYHRRTDALADALDIDPEIDLIHCFTKKGMFRRDLEPNYKANRTQPKPLGFSELKAKCVDLPWAVMHEQVEADDLIGIFATQLASKKQDICIVSGDKDLLQIPGYHYWHEPFWHSKSKQPLREWLTSFGMQEFTPNLFTVSEEAAERFFYCQILAGDSTDGISGCPGTGMVGATKEVGKWDITKPVECWERVVQLYAKKGLGESEAIKQARLVRILRNNEYDLTTSTVELWTPPQ